MSSSPPHETGSPARSTGKTALAWTAITALTALTQIVLRRTLAPGEFGTMNALFGVALVLAAPLAAFSFFLRRTLGDADLADLHRPVLQRAALAWGIACVVLLFVALPPLQLPRSSLQFFTPLATAALLLAICGHPATPFRWCAVIGIGAAVLRLIVSAWAARAWPVAESGVVALIAGALFAGLPALRDRPGAPPLTATWPALRPVIVPGFAAIGVALAVALFSNADRIAAQPKFGVPDPNELPNLVQYEPGGASHDEGRPFVNYRALDDYHAAGFCMRGLLGALLPLLFLLHARRTGLARTTRASLGWLWIYLAALLAGTLLLGFGAPLANALFNLHFFETSITSDGRNDTGYLGTFLPGFAGAFFMLGLVQAAAFFALASRRHVECFVLAACSIAYTAFLFYAGHQPQLMTSCMFGGALISLMLVLFVGVIRYARSHP